MTQFGHETDISGLEDNFSILGEFHDLAGAQALLNDTGDRVRAGTQPVCAQYRDSR